MLELALGLHWNKPGNFSRILGSFCKGTKVAQKYPIHFSVHLRGLCSFFASQRLSPDIPKPRLWDVLALVGEKVGGEEVECTVVGGG